MKILTEQGEFPAKRSDLSARIVNALGPNYAPTYLVFDGADYSGAHNLLAEFRDVAFTWIRGQPTVNVPGYLFDLMNHPASAAIIWLSRKAVEYPDPLFSWVLAHECRHVFQSRCAWPRDNVRRNIATLRRKPEYSKIPPEVFGPTEIDAEICAFKAVPDIVGGSEFQEFYASQMLPRYPRSDYRSFVREVAQL